MEELQIIVDMVSKLPQMALWVLIGLWAYKIAVVGSVYGVIRFVVAKTHDYLVTRRTLPPEVKTVELRPVLDGVTITGQIDALVAQLHRVRMHVNGGGELRFMHADSVDWLREAIDDKIRKDASGTLKRETSAT